MKAVNSAKRKRVEEAMDLGQCDCQNTWHGQNVNQCSDGATHSHGRDKVNRLQIQKE